MTNNLNPRTYKNLPDVQVFDDDGSGNWNGRATVISREFVRDIGDSRVAGAKTVRETLKKPGIYIIWSHSGTQQLPRLYVGYADNCLARLKDHDKKQPFWTEAVVLTSYIKLEGPKHRKRRRWLEATLLDLANSKESEGFCRVENTNLAETPDLTVPSERILSNMFSGFLVCLSHVGLDFLNTP